MKLLQTLILLFSFSLLFSQNEDFLKNPDIVWAAEVETDFVVDNYLLAERNDNNYIFTLKFLQKHSSLFDSEKDYLSKYILENMYSEKLKIYSDKNLTYPLDSSKFIIIDTIINCNAQDYDDPQFYYHLNKLNSVDISYFRLYQLIYYNAAKSEWVIIPKSLGIVEDVYNEMGDSLGQKVIFWIEISNAHQKLLSRNITWAKRLTTRRNSVDIDIVKVLKKTFVNPMHHFIETLKTKPQKTFYSDVFSENRKLTLSERAKVISSIDTSTEMKYGKTIKNVVKKELDLTKVKKLRLVQNWVWDDKKKRLCIWLEAVAPIKREEDEDGNFLFETNLFYQRNDQ